MQFAKASIIRSLSFLVCRLRHSPLGRLKPLTSLYAKLVLRLHGPDTVNVGPFQVRFDPQDRFVARKLVVHGGYEKQEIALLCSLIKPGDHAIDIGANIGLYSLHLSHAVGRDGVVVAVEPDPDNLALLRAHLDAKRCNNVTVVPCAFGEKSTTTELFRVDYNRGNLSLADVSGTGRWVTVAMRRAEHVLNELGVTPNIAKIDVAGAEPLIEHPMYGAG